MKKVTTFFSVMLSCLFMFILCSCGGNMKGWPTLDLNLDIESYDEVSLEYHHRSAHSDRMPLDIDRDYYGTSADKEIISEVYQSIDGRLYSEETYNKIDTENYWSKVVITFWKDGKAGYTFTFYEYSVQNGYFIFDNGEIHKYLGDFVSGTYEKFKDKLSQNVDDDDIKNKDQLQYVYLSQFNSWINELQEKDIQQVRYEHAYNGVAPGMLKDISYSTNSIDIQSAYCLLSSPLKAITDEEGHITGGGYVKYDYFTANNKTYSITVSNNTVLINNQYYQFVDTFYYAFQYSDLDCNSFITDDIPACEAYEIYTYAEESVKVGDYSGLGEFEFCVYDGLIESALRYYLRSSAVNLLILSSNQFMIEGDDNTVVYQITGEKDFSALFAGNNE